VQSSYITNDIEFGGSIDFIAIHRENGKVEAEIDGIPLGDVLEQKAFFLDDRERRGLPHKTVDQRGLSCVYKGKLSL